MLKDDLIIEIYFDTANERNKVSEYLNANAIKFVHKKSVNEFNLFSKEQKLKVGTPFIYEGTLYIATQIKQTSVCQTMHPKGYYSTFVLAKTPIFRKKTSKYFEKSDNYITLAKYYKSLINN